MPGRVLAATPGHPGVVVATPLSYYLGHMTSSNVQGEPLKRPGRGAAAAARGEVTRSAITRAAAELIGEEGWGGVTTRAIAARAGVPHAAVSYHFRGREALLREAAMVTTTEFFAAAIEVLSTAPGGLTGAITATLGAYRDLPAVRDRLAVVLEANRQATRDPWLAERMREILHTYIAGLTTIIEADQAAGRLDPGLSAPRLAAVVAGALDGIGLQAAFDSDVDVMALGATLTQLLDSRSETT
jgi:AcrR family transcriptional regulator